MDRFGSFWLDGPAAFLRAESWQSGELLEMARKLQSGVVINNRSGLPGDFDTPEQQIGQFQINRPWETCDTLGTQWSWKPGDQMKSFKECLDILVECAVGGGNLLLDV